MLGGLGKQKKSNKIAIRLGNYEVNENRMINYKHLHYFWAVAREGGVARASERLT